MSAKMAAGVLCPMGEKFLAIRRNKDGALGIPCGKLDKGESFLSAAAREFNEETGGTTGIRPRPLYVSKHDGVEVWIFLSVHPEVQVPAKTAEGETLLVTPEELISDPTFGQFNAKVLEAYVRNEEY